MQPQVAFRLNFVLAVDYCLVLFLKTNYEDEYKIWNLAGLNKKKNLHDDLTNNENPKLPSKT